GNCVEESRGCRIRARVWNPGYMVSLFREKPSTWPNCRGNSVKGDVSLGKVKENCTGMHEIERFCFERIGDDVVLTNLEIRKIERIQESRVDVGRDHSPGRADVATQPVHDGTTAGSDVQALPPLGDAKIRQVALCPGVEHP